MRLWLCYTCRALITRPFSGYIVTFVSFAFLSRRSKLKALSATPMHNLSKGRHTVLIAKEEAFANKIQ